MPPGQKRFVKYTFDETKINKVRQPRQSRDNFKDQTNNTPTNTTNNRTRRHVSYTEKSTFKQNVLNDMINSFVQIKKPSKQVEQLLKNFPKYFNSTPKQPQAYSTELLNGYLIMLGKKNLQSRNYAPIQQSQQEPHWDSGSDIEGGIQSRKIDEKVIETIQQKYNDIKQLRTNELKRHQKQFLEDFYRQKHQQQLQKQQQAAKNQPTQEQKQQKSLEQNNLLTQAFDMHNFQAQNDWTDYQQKQVNEFVNMGFIQKIEPNQQEEEQGEFEFGDQDFSVEGQKSDKDENQSHKSQTSSEGDDDIFGDVGPTTIIKKKQQKASQKQHSKQSQNSTQGTVVINSQIFSRIAQLAGVPPGACTWIIRNKNQRYRVTTQFMDEMYRLNNFCESLPYVSLNHSQFVHNNDVQKQKSLLIFKDLNARRQFNHPTNSNHHYHQRSGGNRNENNRRKINYKPNVIQNTNQKTHLNKK